MGSSSKGEGAEEQMASRASPASANHPTLLSLSHVRRSPKWTFRGRNQAPVNTDAPGPGAYVQHSPEHTSRFAASPRFGFPNSARESRSKVRGPGPGAYTPANGGVGSGAAYSLTPRRAGIEGWRRHVPGPGTHNVGTAIGSGPKYSAASRQADANRAIAPGPGAYDMTDNGVAGKTPRWGFGTSIRPNTTSPSAATTPGPGAYGSVNSVVGSEGPKFSFKARLPAPRQHPSPGPGAHGGHYSSFG